MTGAHCSARLRNGDPRRSVATHDQFRAYHAALANELGHDVIANGDHTKKRNDRQREPVIAESEPLELSRARQEHRPRLGRHWPSPRPKRWRRAGVENGDRALRSEVESGQPKTSATIARLLAEVARASAAI